MILSTVTKKRVKPGPLDTRIVRRFILLPVLNIFGDKKVWLEFRHIFQIYDDSDGLYRWRTLFYVDEEQEVKQ